MIIKNIIIQKQKIKINECPPKLIQALQDQLKKDIVYLYHDHKIQWEFGDTHHSNCKYTYQLTANEIVEISNYLEFISNNLDLKYQETHETFLLKEEEEILKCFMENDMNLSKTAKSLQLYRYRIYQIFDQIREKTKLDPRCFYDLEQLHKKLERSNYDKKNLHKSTDMLQLS